MNAEWRPCNFITSSSSDSQEKIRWHASAAKAYLSRAASLRDVPTVWAYQTRHKA